MKHVNRRWKELAAKARTHPVRSALLAACILLTPAMLLAQDAHQITGAWQLSIKLQVPGEPVIVNLAAFHADGTVVNVPGAAPDSFNTFSSVGVGVWRHAAGSQVQANFYSMMNVPTNAGPILLGYQRATGKFTLSQDGSTLSGTFTADILDPAGNIQQSFLGTIEGKRISLN